MRQGFPNGCCSSKAATDSPRPRAPTWPWIANLPLQNLEGLSALILPRCSLMCHSRGTASRPAVHRLRPGTLFLHQHSPRPHIGVLNTVGTSCLAATPPTHPLDILSDDWLVPRPRAGSEPVGPTGPEHTHTPQPTQTEPNQQPLGLRLITLPQT